MKEKDAREDFDPQQIILYVEKEDGSYGSIQTGSYISKNFLDDFWFKRINLEKQFAEKLCKNELSPVFYYMTLCELSEAELAARAGICKYKVKKHLYAKGFSKITVSELKRYAHVFDIPVANLFQIILYQENDILKSFFIKEKEPSLFEIVQIKTDNPFVVKTVIKKKEK